MVILTFDSEQLNKIIQNAVRSVLAETPTPPAASDDGKELLTRKEAAALAGVCLATLDNKVKDGVLRKYRTGGVVRFRRSEVVEAFSQSMFHNDGRKGNSYSRAKKS